MWTNAVIFKEREGDGQKTVVFEAVVTTGETSVGNQRRKKKHTSVKMDKNCVCINVHRP